MTYAETLLFPDPADMPSLSKDYLGEISEVNLMLDGILTVTRFTEIVGQQFNGDESPFGDQLIDKLEPRASGEEDDEGTPDEPEPTWSGKRSAVSDDGGTGPGEES
jgi:hypothetical protein